MQTQQLVTVFLIAFSVPQRHFQTNKQYKVKTFSITTQQKMWSILEYTLKDNVFLRKICFLLCLAAQAVSPWVYFSLCTPPRCLYLFTVWISFLVMKVGWVDGFLLKSTDISFVFAVLRMRFALSHHLIKCSVAHVFPLHHIRGLLNLDHLHA